MQNGNRKAPDADFSKVMETAIFKGTSNLIGEGTAQALLFHLNMRRYDDAEEFDSKLKEILSTGAEVVEQCVIDELSKTMGVQLRETGDDYASCVAHAERIYREKGRLQEND